VDDAPVRRVLDARGHQRALSLSARRGPDRTLDGLRPADADGVRFGRVDGRRRGRQGRGRDRLARRHGDRLRRHPARRGLDLDDDQRAGVGAAGDVHRGGRPAGRRPRGASRDDPERYLEGVYRTQYVHLSAGVVDADHHGHLRFLCLRDAEVQHHLDLGLSHPRGRLDGCPGTRLHAGRRHRVRRDGDRGRTRRR